MNFVLMRLVLRESVRTVCSLNNPNTHLNFKRVVLVRGSWQQWLTLTLNLTLIMASILPSTKRCC